jgi:hypothetical protein
METRVSMDDEIQLRLVKREAVSSIVQVLETALERARDGKLQAVLVVAKDVTISDRSWFCGSVERKDEAEILLALEQWKFQVLKRTTE